MKLVFILQHPIERAFSNYLWSRRNGLETLSFEEALQREGERERAYEPVYVDPGYRYGYGYAPVYGQPRVVYAPRHHRSGARRVAEARGVIDVVRAEEARDFLRRVIHLVRHAA